MNYQVVEKSVITLATLFVVSLSLAHAQAPTAQPAQPAPSAQQPADPGWPRTYTKEGTTVILYQPQVDAWKDHEKIRWRAALEITTAGASKPNYGVLAAEADTDVDRESGTVILTNIKPAVRFPDLSEEQAAPLKALVKELLPNRPSVTISLDRVLAYMHDTPPEKTVPVNMDPPPIFYSDSPAILVNFMGKPEFKPVKDTKLMFAANTNWLILLDPQTQKYYLLADKSWLSTSDPLKGPWTAAGTLPAEFSKVPTDGSWDEVRKNLPGEPVKVVPRVIASTEPAELIATKGEAAYSPITGTTLMYVNNPEMPVFMDMSSTKVYFLVAGRWFSARALTGPWAAASADLPAEFKKIPQDSPMAFVLASVPGTVEAKDAVLLAQVPQKATVKIKDTKVTVSYEGTPKFEPIEGTSMKYAVNTSDQVIFADNKYYCCNKGVWFVSPAPTGDWVVCTAVPPVIYTIPPTSPVYNVTYVKVYNTTPTDVVFGYTSGYSGEYVAATGALMFGAGMIVGAALTDNDCCWYGYHPAFYSYGCAPYYHWGYGGYYRTGMAHYGPYGGTGWAAGYNPATGNYYRGGAAYGAGAAHWGGEAYNPWTNTYGAHTGGTNGYKSWGNSYVQQGNKWAEGSHESTARGSAGYAENSSGQWAEGAHSKVTDSSAVKTSSGDLYAGHDGNVYKNTGSGWQTYNHGSWNDVQKPAGYSNEAGNLSHESGAQNEWKNNFNSSSWQNNWENKSSSAEREGEGMNHETMGGLDHDSASRSYGEASRSYGGGERSYSGGGYSGFHGGGGRRR